MTPLLQQTAARYADKALLALLLDNRLSMIPNNNNNNNNEDLKVPLSSKIRVLSKKQQWPGPIAAVHPPLNGPSQHCDSVKVVQGDH